MELKVNNKIVGTLQNGVLSKRGKQAVLFEKFNGFGFTRGVLANEQIKQIEVHYKGKIYRTTPSIILQNGIPYDYNGDFQLILNLRFWSVVDPKQTPITLYTPTVELPPNDPNQTTLV